MFTSLDTVAGAAQHPLSMNRFLYAEANPATLVDPSGHCTSSWWCDALTWNPMTSFVAPYLPDDAPRQVANAIQPVSPQAAMAIGMADRAGALTQDTVVGAYQLYRATTNPATAPRVARDLLDLATTAAEDPGAAVRGSLSTAAFHAADWVGHMHDELTSGTAYDFGSASVDVTVVVDAVAGGVGAARGAVHGVAGLRGGRAAMDIAEAEAANEGIYVIRGSEGTYVGQSGNISSRFVRHMGRFTRAELDVAERIPVSGGKTAREIAEQLKIDELGGIDKLLNKVNPIGPRRLPLMPRSYHRIR